ncbi:MAG: hypothetical protein ACYDCL_13565 [Myxococcales bacterium]
MLACAGSSRPPSATSGASSGSTGSGSGGSAGGGSSGGGSSGGSTGGGGSSGGCPDGQAGRPEQLCNGTCADVSVDPQNCGGCGVVCPGEGCSGGLCECNPLSSGGCAVGQLCDDGACRTQCALGSSGCGAGAFCRVFGSTEPPGDNVGVCLALGPPDGGAFGAPCLADGGATACAGDLSFCSGVSSTAPGQAGCTAECDPLGPSSCPSGWGCLIQFDSQTRYIGYGLCAPDAGQAGRGAACSLGADCQPGLLCGTGICQAPCNPWAASACSSGTYCIPLVSGDGQYVGIGGCSVSGGAGSLGAPCTYSTDCSENLACIGLPDGGSACTDLCDPRGLDGGCPAGLACDWLFTESSGFYDYAHYGACVAGNADGGGFLDACGGDAGSCSENLVCLAFPGETICEQYCDPFAPQPCPGNHVCWPQADQTGAWGGYGLCGARSGSGPAGQPCSGNGACASGDCYFPTFSSTEGICIQACALGGVLGCGSGICADGGFGNGLGFCIQADGGAWD